jgi:hypothetical protein
VSLERGRRHFRQEQVRSVNISSSQLMFAKKETSTVR